MHEPWFLFCEHDYICRKDTTINSGVYLYGSTKILSWIINIWIESFVQCSTPILHWPLVPLWWLIQLYFSNAGTSWVQGLWEYKDWNAPVSLILFLPPADALLPVGWIKSHPPVIHSGLWDVGCLCCVSSTGCSFFLYLLCVCEYPLVSHSSRWHITSLSSFCQAAKSRHHCFDGPTVEWEP